MATVSKNFRVKNGLVVEGTTGTINGNNIVTDADTTDIISEGTTNLYFTDGRVQDVIVNAVQENISITSTDGLLYITAENGVDGSTTDDLDEGTVNLYFTNQRAIDAVAGGTFSSDVVEEGTTNLYFTNQRAVDAVINGAVDTDDIEEGTANLYFTSTRARESVGAGTGINYSSTDGLIYVDTDEIATRQYVDAATAGLNVHDAVKAATIANINLATDLENGDILDNVTLATGNRVLVKDQTTKTENGVYIVQASGAAVRATDYNEPGEVDAGDFIFVEGGTINGKTGWVQTNSITTIGSDNIEFTQFSGVGTYVGGTGIDINAEEISIDFSEFNTNSITEGTTNLYFTNQRAVDAVIGGAVDTDDIEEGTANLYFTNQRAVDAVINGAVDTDDIEEGTTNLYYTTQKVYNDLASSVQENISITTTDGLLYVTAENGVASATTDDLDEGTTNLYFTDQRAVNALEAVVPNFTAVEINSVSKQVAAVTNVTVAETPTVVYTMDSTEYRSAKFIVKAAFGTHTEISEILLTLDTSNNIAITEYAIVGTNGNLINVTAAFNTPDVLLQVSAVNANTSVTVFGTLIV